MTTPFFPKPARRRSSGEAPSRPERPSSRPDRHDAPDVSRPSSRRPSPRSRDQDRRHAPDRFAEQPRERRQPGSARRPDDARGPRLKDAGRGARPAQPPFTERAHSEEGAAERMDGRPDTQGTRPAASADSRPDSHPDSHPDERVPLLPGLKPVLELLESDPGRVDAVFLRKGRHGREMDRIADLCREAGVRFSLLESESFARIYAGKSQGVVARLYEAGYVDLEGLIASVMDAPLPLILVLDQVQDPGNAGTLARTLYALGGAGLVIPRHNGVYLGAVAAKAAAGALEKLPVAKAANLGQVLETAKKHGLTVYGAYSGAGRHKNAPPPAPQSAEDGAARTTPRSLAIFDLVPRLPAVLVLGSEESGMRPGLEKRCDALLHIPMARDFDSLNVAQAGAVMLAWFARLPAK